MAASKKNNRKPISSRARKRRLAVRSKNALDFQTLEPRQLLAAITVGNATDVLSPTADTSSISSLIANDGGDGISLREAIVAANNTTGQDTVTFDANAFTGGDSNVIRLTQGELVITDSLSIDGSSAGGVLITGDADDDDVTLPGTDVTNVSASFGYRPGVANDLLDDNSRVLNFSGQTGDLNLNGLTITGGRTLATRSGDQSGGGILFASSGMLTLTASSITGNSTGGGVTDDVSRRDSGHGGGIYAGRGSVTIVDSTVSDNSTGGGGNINAGGDAGDAGDGGGIFAMNVTLTNSTVSGNSTGMVATIPDTELLTATDCTS